jgi:hypothetical protein
MPTIRKVISGWFNIAAGIVQFTVVLFTLCSVLLFWRSGAIGELACPTLSSLI